MANFKAEKLSKEDLKMVVNNILDSEEFTKIDVRLNSNGYKVIATIYEGEANA